MKVKLLTRSCGRKAGMIVLMRILEDEDYAKRAYPNIATQYERMAGMDFVYYRSPAVVKFLQSISSDRFKDIDYKLIED